MKYKNKLHSILLPPVIMVLFLILVLSAASADEQSASPAIIETRITTDPSTSENPVIYGNTIVWQDDRNGNWDIYIQDLSNKKETHTTNESNQTNPDIYGNRVVWEDDRNGGHDIYMQGLSTKTQTRITNNGKAYNPKIYGNRIVWTDGRNGGSWDGYYVGNWDIYMYDISTQKETQITTNTSMQANPGIYGDRIVYEDNREWGASEIGMYNLSTHQETLLSDFGLYIYKPVIYGNWIAWGTDADNIAIHEISTPKSENTAPVDTSTDPAIYESSTTQGEQEVKYTYDISADPAIYGNRMVYNYFDRFDYTSNISEIRMLNLSTKTEILISKNGRSPEIYGNKIVWVDWRNGNDDIYMGTLVYPPVASLTASPLYGKAPLSVKFTDQSTGSPTSWSWSFGDGTNSTQKNPTHTYSSAGSYTVSLTVSNENGNNTETKTGYINVEPVSSKLVAAFSAFPTSGNAPLNVVFTDRSAGSPTSWNWNFGDGTASNQQNPEHTYSTAGSYPVNLTVSNENETASIIATINVLEQIYSNGSGNNGGSSNDGSSSGGSSSDGSSSGGSSNGGSSSGGSSHSSGGGGGGGGSPEPQSNVEVKELSQAFVTSGNNVKFDFPQKVTAVVYVSFDSMKTLGKITTIAEMLKGKSALVPELPAGEVYKSFNVWVGNGGVSTPKNIENSVLCFKVEKSWLQNKSIDPASIALNMYSDNKWEVLPVNMSGEDSEYMYFTANVLGFSSFAITGSIKSISEQKEASENQTVYEQPGEKLPSAGSVQLTNDTNDTVIKGGSEKKTAGFEIVLGIVCLLGVFFYKRK